MAIVGPIALYNNVPINAQFYQPSRFQISAITLGLSTLVTTSADHNYVIGNLIRLIIPPGYGSRQLNEQSGYVTSIPAPNQVVLALNSTNADLFISSSPNTTVPETLCIGDINSGQINANGRVTNKIFIPGSFQNISPQ